MKRKGKQKKIITDFSVEKLPHTRPQVYKTLLRIRFGFIMKISLIAFLLFLPALLWNSFMRLTILSIQVSEEASSIPGQIMGSTLIRCAVNLPLFLLVGIGIGGSLLVFQKLVWNEIVYVSDFFSDFKINIKRYLGLGLLSGIGYDIFLLLYHLAATSGNKAFINGIIIALGVVIFILLTIFSLFSYAQNNIYQVNLINLIFNSVKFTFKGLFFASIQLVILLCPFALLFIGNFYLDLVADLLILFTFPLSMLYFILYSNLLFDRNINKEQYPEIYDKGIYR